MISDVALIELPAPVLFNDFVKPVCLPSIPAKVGEQCIISGEDIFMIWNVSPHEKTFPLNDTWAIFSKLNISKNRKTLQFFPKGKEKGFCHHDRSLSKITWNLTLFKLKIILQNYSSLLIILYSVVFCFLRSITCLDWCSEFEMFKLSSPSLWSTWYLISLLFVKFCYFFQYKVY